MIPVLTTLVGLKNRIVDVFTDIRTAILNKGITVSTNVSTYANAILSIASGSSSASNININGSAVGFSSTLSEVKTQRYETYVIGTYSLYPNYFEYDSQDSTKLIVKQDFDCIVFTTLSVGVSVLNSTSEYAYTELHYTRNEVENIANSCLCNYDACVVSVSSIMHFKVGDVIRVMVGYTRGSSATTTNNAVKYKTYMYQLIERT